MKILVTGGTGFIGSHLVDALVARGDEVTVLDNLRRSQVNYLQPHLESGHATFYQSDIRDYLAVERAMEGASLVYHLAAQSNVMGAVVDYDYSFTTNVVGTFNMLKAASVHQVTRVVFSSSREVYGEPDHFPVSETAPLSPKNTYGASKMAGEAYCRVWPMAAGVDCQILRFTNVYGPRDRDRVIPIFLERVQAGQDLELYGGQQVIDFVWIAIAVQALLAAAVCPNDGPINVGSGQGTRLAQLAQRIVALAGSATHIDYLPARQVEVVRFIADVSRMNRKLGILPPADPLEHLADMMGHRE